MRNITVCLTVILLVTPIICGQSRKDPLNDDEIDQIREYADRPPERLKLYIKFIEQRATSIKQLTDNHRAADRDLKIGNLLEEFTHLVDELQDNLDEYQRQHADLRKTLKDLIPTGGKWLEIVNASPTEGSYDLSRKTAIEAAATLNDSAKDMLTSEEKYFVSHKPDKSYEKKEK
jgi:hypothetical protein